MLSFGAMKKQRKIKAKAKKLGVKTETVRKLADQKLDGVGGGLLQSKTLDTGVCAYCAATYNLG